MALGNGDYEVHYIGVNWPHHIFVNQDFQVIGANELRGFAPARRGVAGLAGVS